MKKPLNAFPVRLATVERILAVFGLGAGIFVQIYLGTKSWGKLSSINSPSFFPQVVAIGFLIIAVALLISSFRTDKDKIVTINFGGFLIIAIWAVAMFLNQYLGFLIPSICALTVSLWLWGVKSKKWILIVGIFTPVIIFIIFGQLLHVHFNTLFL